MCASMALRTIFNFSIARSGDAATLRLLAVTSQAIGRTG